MNVGTPLRPTDSNRLGPYQLLRRLGEGGMGTVYLGRTATGQLVAIKVIRGEYADEPEFRLRFRSEVAHAQTVPPFCTAEVIDADPDHETPYLVVEYVDGPSLSQAVADRGPLTPSNLHALAIGVATALTAIHRAGIIHRDLKPSNVLLAPGSPKVIDFGIARAAAAVTSITRTDQLMGTVGYMAPERLEPGTADAITSAADIFAWGAVVAYAASGYPPFHSDSPATTAIAILTGEPDLGGLAGPLRDLVARALAKNPAERPTARELLDELLMTPSPGHFTSSENRNAPTSRVRGTGRVATDEALTHGVANAHLDIHPGSSARVSAPNREPRRRHRTGRNIVIAALVLVMLAGGALVAGVLSGVVHIPLGPAANAGHPTLTPTPLDKITIPAGFPAIYLRDPLTRPVKGHWTNRPDDGTGFNASCLYAKNGYQVSIATIGQSNTWRCRSPQDTFGDFQVSVSVTLESAGSCAGLWFRFFGTDAGYAMQICEDVITLGLHSGAAPTLQPLTTPYVNKSHLVLGQPYRFSVIARGTTYTMLGCAIDVKGCINPQVLGQATDNSLPNPGTIQIGLFEPGSADRSKQYGSAVPGHRDRHRRAARVDPDAVTVPPTTRSVAPNQPVNRSK